MLLTDDGELTNRLTHPRHEIPKIYHVTLSKPVSEEQILALRAPMTLDGYVLMPVTVNRLSDNALEMHLYEGRNRQIRRMCENVGLRVSRLCRVAIGTLTLGDLPVGRWRELTEEEIKYLKESHTEKG